ncbi:hypothetical protein TEA_022672 [Camellia sinensis var. sinensis]|uniref:DUF632 domain-containing protein n=1 Tax=Camellia sinensis var. sinensis TaxID=542762 RepID=A0A4S4DNT2_CAMSN|nr:hypothetical protein TEA_022672 [Camellia sinensis var. sinensis]
MVSEPKYQGWVGCVSVAYMLQVPLSEHVECEGGCEVPHRLATKDEERLRGIYAKEQKKLKKLDDRGVESGKIDATYNSIKKLLLKIKVAVSTVDAISKRINKLRDEELRPRLNELILRICCAKLRLFITVHQLVCMDIMFDVVTLTVCSGLLRLILDIAFESSDVYV